MPVPTASHLIWISRNNAQRDEAGTLFYRVVANLDQPGPIYDRRLRDKKIILLCKAALFAFNVNDKSFDYILLRRFYTEEGIPLSLDSHILTVEQRAYDGIQDLILILESTYRSAVKVVIRKEGMERKAYVTIWSLVGFTPPGEDRPRR